MHKLFKQIKQNFPLRYFYGESANAIKIQVWVTLIANLLLMVLQKRIKRKWSFSGLATNRIPIRHLKNCFSSPKGLTFKKNIRNTVTTALRMDIFFSANF